MTFLLTTGSDQLFLLRQKSVPRLFEGGAETFITNHHGLLVANQAGSAAFIFHK